MGFGRSLPLIPVLRPEVHVLQLRLRRVPAGPGAALLRRAQPRTRGVRMALAARYGLPRRRHAQPHPARSTRPNCSRAIPGHPWTEATIEAAPGAITPDQAEAWRRAGINRVSLGRAVVRRGRNRAHRPQTHAADRGRRVALLRAAGIAQLQHRPDRRTPRPDRGELARIARLDRAPRRRRTSPSTCWRSTRTAASATRCCSAACATAPRIALRRPHRRLVRDRRRAPGRRWASRATRSRISPGPASNRATT